MRILFVTPYFAPAWSYGGIVKVVFDLAQRLDALGHQVTVATTDVLDKERRMQDQPNSLGNIRVIYFRNVSNTLAFRFNGYLPLAFGRWCKSNLKNFDVIHCHDAYTWLNIVVARYAARAGVPFVVQPHGAVNSERIQGQRTLAKKVFLKMFMRIFASAAAIVVSTKLERETEIARLGKSLVSKSVVIPNGLPESQIAAHHHDQGFRSALGVGEDDLCILYFGRLHYIKGVDISLHALAQVKDLPWKFIIVSQDFGEEARLRHIVQSLDLTHRVVFRPAAFGSKMRDYLANADVFLFNSRSEGLPMSVLDACAAGLPCILSPGCNVPEVAEYGAGIVLTENSPSGTADALRRFFKSKELQRSMEVQAHRVIREYFNLDRIVQELLKLYTSFVAKS